MPRTNSIGRLVISALVLGLTGCSALAAASGSASGTNPAAIAPEPVGASAGPWVLVGTAPAKIMDMTPLVRPFKYQAARLDPEALSAVLKTVPLEDTQRARTEPGLVVLPLPDATFARYSVIESPIMEPALALKWSDIKTYLLQGIDDPTASGRMVVSPRGVHVSVFGVEGSVYIQRLSRDNNEYYASYFGREFSEKPESWTCGTKSLDAVAPHDLPQLRVGQRPDRGLGDPSSKSGRTRYTYRLAMATTGEYFAESGGLMQTRDNVAAIVATGSAIFEREVAGRFMLVANNDLLLFPDAAVDPYAAPGTDVSSPDFNTGPENQIALDDIIGEDNYDVGHVVHFDPMSIQGRAGGIGVICLNGLKGNGFSQTTGQLVTPFTHRIVMHEIGHQFSGRHSFNNCNGAPGDSAAVAAEPGSGSTIMSYAGICANNVQNLSDPYYGQLNFEQIYGYISTGVGTPCAVLAPTGNNEPVVTAPTGFTIPSKTPFVLTAQGSDPDNDAITYCWESRDVGTALSLPLNPSQDNGQSPLARSFPPSTSPRRTFPSLAGLINPAQASTAELLPQISRTMNWRVTVRDNRAGAGGVATADTTLTVIGFAGPFSVTAPNGGGGAISGVTTVTWSVANTNFQPIDCQNVRILLSTDSGNNYPIELLASTPNTGSATVVLPSLTTTNARIRIEAINNIFFDISDTNFSINPPGAGVNIIASGAPTIDDRAGNGNNNRFIDPGESNVAINVPLVNTGNTTAVAVSATLSSLSPTAAVLASSVQYGAMPYGSTVVNPAPFRISLGANHPCGSPINLRLNLQTITSTGTSAQSVVNFSVVAGSGPLVAPAQAFRYIGENLPIPDNSVVGTDVPITISGIGGTVADLDVLFEGTGCTGTNAALQDYPGAGLTHSFVGDLVVTLRSPAGTTVALMNRPGVGTPGRSGSSGNNFCNTRLNDQFAGPTIQTITATAAPYAATFPPNSPLAAFNGQDPNGTWTLNISDRALGDTGVFRGVALILSPNNPPACAAPALTGACCLSNSCVLTNTADCASQVGNFRGNSTVCSPSPCPTSTGACCVAAGCSLTTPAACVGGRFAGGGIACNTATNFRSPCCKADINQNGSISAQDIFDYLTDWFANSPRADINLSGTISAQDIFDFLSAWFGGC